MGTIKIKMPDIIERVFRKIAMQKFGYRKGSISEAAQQAIENWVSLNVEYDYENMKDPIEEISGLLKNVKKTSLELQHEVGNIMRKKYAHRR